MAPRYRKVYETLTNIYCDEDGNERLNLFTTSPTHARKVMAKGAKSSRIGKMDGEEISWEFDLPVEWHKLPSPKRTVNEEERQRRSERAKARGGVGQSLDDEEEGDDE